MTSQVLLREDESRDTIWSRRSTAVDSIPPTEVGAVGPIFQGSVGVIGDALLEVKQCAKILSVLMYCLAVDVGNTITQQQKWQYCKHGKFRRMPGVTLEVTYINCHLQN